MASGWSYEATEPEDCQATRLLNSTVAFSYSMKVASSFLNEEEDNSERAQRRNAPNLLPPEANSKSLSRRNSANRLKDLITTIARDTGAENKDGEDQDADGHEEDRADQESPSLFTRPPRPAQSPRNEQPAREGAPPLCPKPMRSVSSQRGGRAAGELGRETPGESSPRSPRTPTREGLTPPVRRNSNSNSSTLLPPGPPLPINTLQAASGSLSGLTSQDNSLTSSPMGSARQLGSPARLPPRCRTSQMGSPRAVHSDEDSGQLLSPTTPPSNLSGRPPRLASMGGQPPIAPTSPSEARGNPLTSVPSLPPLMRSPSNPKQRSDSHSGAPSDVTQSWPCSAAGAAAAAAGLLPSRPGTSSRRTSFSGMGGRMSRDASPAGERPIQSPVHPAVLAGTPPSPPSVPRPPPGVGLRDASPNRIPSKLPGGEPDSVCVRDRSRTRGDVGGGGVRDSSRSRGDTGGVRDSSRGRAMRVSIDSTSLTQLPTNEGEGRLVHDHTPHIVEPPMPRSLPKPPPMRSTSTSRSLRDASPSAMRPSQSTGGPPDRPNALTARDAGPGAMRRSLPPMGVSERGSFATRDASPTSRGVLNLTSELPTLKPHLMRELGKRLASNGKEVQELERAQTEPSMEIPRLVDGQVFVQNEGFSLVIPK
eukprot:gene16602-22842_t